MSPDLPFQVGALESRFLMSIFEPTVCLKLRLRLGGSCTLQYIGAQS